MNMTCLLVVESAIALKLLSGGCSLDMSKVNQFFTSVLT
ncbi:hypothetical protein GLYMA_14G085550v4 [Glycine max]|nr:hypothetical protein GLYMA_14G085550v4 [Glycine max]KAH1093694.1 hypothetical protein GYH30_039427 [Glycine max]